MACVSSLRSNWEKADSSYIETTKSGGRTPVSRRLFPQATISEYQRTENECENASETSSNHESLGDFDAIPEEFRPSRRGNDLMKVRASPKKANSKDWASTERPLQNERFSNKSNAPQPKRYTRNSNSSTVQDEVRDYRKEILETEESKYSQREIDKSSDETGKSKKCGGMFFYSDSSQNESTSKTAPGCPQNGTEKENNRKSSEKSKFQNARDENHFQRFYDSESSRSKATNGSIENPKEEADFYTCTRPKFPENNTNNLNRGNKDTNFPKCNKSIPPKFQERTVNSQNKNLFVDKRDQKIKGEITVEKRIKWKNDLCDFKKSENRPNFFYEYTKTTKESVRYVPKHSEDNNDDDEVTKIPYQEFKRGRDFCNNFRRMNLENNKPKSQNQKGKVFDSTFNAQEKESKNFFRARPQKSFNKFEEKHKSFQCGNGKGEIIVRHEIKVIHVNQQGKGNRTFNNSSQTYRPHRGSNGKMINTNYRERNGKMTNNDNRERYGNVNNKGPRESDGKVFNNDHRERGGNMVNDDHRKRNGNMIHIDSRERNGKIINTEIRENCGAQEEKNTMTKPVEAFQNPRKDFVRIPLKLTGTPSKTENTLNNVPRTRNNENAAILIKYGREISDMIAGSYVAITTFLDNYEQWKDFRRVTMLLFEEVEKNLSKSCHKNKRIVEVAELVGTGCKMVQYVPHVGLSVAAKVIAFLSDVVARIFSASSSAKSIGMDDFQLRLSLQRDMESTSDIYMYGMQCDINFQETCEIIEEFHREIQDGRFEEFEETFETGFLREISLLNPYHSAVFYKKLGRFYKVLNEHQQSEEGKAFCGAFEDWPDALTTVSRLHRRFKTENWDSSSVMKAWEEVYNLLQNDQSVVSDVLKKIQDCICELIREQTAMERYVMDLQRQC